MKILFLIALSMTLLTAAAQDYPPTRKSDQSDTYHGIVIKDPYRWLEDDNSDETKAWVTAQNAVTEKYLAALPQRERIKADYTRLYNFEKFGIPFQEGGRYFWGHNDGLQQQSVIFTSTALNNEAGIAIDPNTLSKDGTVALTGTSPSRDGRYLAYGVAGAGSDWQEWRVRDLTTGKDLPDVVKWVKFSGADWTPDNKGFFYSRFDEPKTGEALTEGNYFQKLYYHRLGEAQANDTLVYERKDQKEWGFDAHVNDEGTKVIISVWKGSGRKNGLMWFALGDGGTYIPAEPTIITLDFDAEYSPVGTDGNTLWVKTDKDAPKGKLMAVDLNKPTFPNWKTLITERSETLGGVSAVGQQFFAQYLKDAAGQIRSYTVDGKLIRDVKLPGVGTVTGFGGRWLDKETFFSFTSLTAPGEIYRYDIAAGKATLFKRPKVDFNPDDYETRQVFIASKDGTKFPAFIAHRKGIKLDGSNPTLLYGYGGFNISMTPSYRVMAAAWMKMGGLYVLAGLRGGGEYGADWHDAGTKLKKQNVFDDFIAAAEWLIAKKYTSPAKLAINGGSNGGLLVGAVLNQRPELFGAAVPEVGVMDMLRYHKFTIGWAWASDYGTSDNADEFAALIKYSPLHTVKRGLPYPPVLVMTADHDDRVVPAHSFKYAAEMQDAANETTSGRAGAVANPANKTAGPILIRIETKAGHGAGTPTSKIIEERGDVLAFMANALGMK